MTIASIVAQWLRVYEGQDTGSRAVHTTTFARRRGRARREGLAALSLHEHIDMHMHIHAKHRWDRSGVAQREWWPGTTLPVVLVLVLVLLVLVLVLVLGTVYPVRGACAGSSG